MRSGAERELRLSVITLGAVLVLTALVAINLLQRMTPALADVLDQNMRSMNAAGDMLASLAAARLPEAEAAAARDRFRAALEEAAWNRSEPEEEALLDELRALEAPAFRGEPLAIQRALAALEGLGRVNRAAAERANGEAKRLGTAGAWAVALLGVLGFGASLLLAQRLSRRLLSPLHELGRVLAAVERGDPLQRCATRGMPGSQLELLGRLNRLLDSSLQRGDGVASAPTGASGLIPGLLDTWGGALVLLDADGKVIAASRAAVELLSSERGPTLREALRGALQGAASDGVSMLRRSPEWALVALTTSPAASLAGDDEPEPPPRSRRAPDE